MTTQETIAASTNILSAIANLSMAITAIYVAYKARNFFKSKTQEIIFNESSKLITSLDLIQNEKKIFNLLFPFKLIEGDLKLWSDNDDFKERVSGYLHFSIKLTNVIKTVYNEIEERTSLIILNGGTLNKNSVELLNEIRESLFLLQRHIGDYNYLTSTLFSIKSDTTHISTYMFHDFSDHPFEERLSLMEPLLKQSIDNTINLFYRTSEKIDEVKMIYSKGKFSH
ncbi:hypothetical protein AB9C21_22340 [Klebsiella michiganensis]|uniref:hypothetical protein n=1 Tax=Klebsiella michiganensis TaxID=1134687 RepID=UPI0021816F0A|nr:hypothetical protein [Klebsiella michiganensis]GKQ23705.1 hypothetical protein NUBL17187_15010 [Klebsiella michiganensis]HCQ8978039.1 hypothetical protein [Klebsiella variicola]HDX9094964.1 hypothetical protein [Klebsiella michiganensis]